MLIKGRTHFWSLCVCEGYTPLPTLAAAAKKSRIEREKGGHVSSQINGHILSAM